jgi:hypothetical protein
LKFEINASIIDTSTGTGKVGVGFDHETYQGASLRPEYALRVLLRRGFA